MLVVGDVVGDDVVVVVVGWVVHVGFLCILVGLSIFAPIV